MADRTGGGARPGMPVCHASGMGLQEPAAAKRLVPINGETSGRCWRTSALRRFLRSLSGASDSLLSSPGQFGLVSCLKLLHCGDTSRFRPRADLFLGD